MVRFHRMPTVCNELPVLERLCKHCHTAVTCRALRRNHRRIRRALDFRCVGEETDSLFVHSYKEGYYVC